MKISVILATYNEAENIRILLPRIAEILDSHGYDWEIIVVDDMSFDGTAEVARRVSVPRADRVHIVLNPNRRGLTYAQLLGIKHASGDVVIIMDADGQHDPKYLPQMIEGIIEGYDVVIGSRYVQGGSPDGLNSLRRYVYSYIANLMPRVLFYPLLGRVRDIMSGFFAVRKEFVCDKIEPRVPKLLLEILVMCRPRKIKEVPIKMNRRLYGESKLGLKHILLYLKQLGSLVKRTFFQ